MILKYFTRIILLLTTILFSFCGSNKQLKIENQNIQVEFNDSLYSKITAKNGSEAIILNDFSATEYLTVDNAELKNFKFANSNYNNFDDALGRGQELVITGDSEDGIQKSVTVKIYESFPSTAFYKVKYTNNRNETITINKWVNNSYRIKTADTSKPAFWSYQGASFEDRRDWVFPLYDGFEQENYMGMNASDYGGGTPITDIWTKKFGLGIGHVEVVPKLVKMPVLMNNQESGANISVEFEKEVKLEPGESIESFETFVNVHKGDYYSTLKVFREVMAKKGLPMQKFTEASYEPIWCAWGYERDFKVNDVLGTLPKVNELGFKWAVLDDGWQTAEGDWYLNPKKFPKGDKDMQAFVAKINAAGLKAKLWWAPLAVDPGTDLIKEHSDMLLLNKDGSTQDISWWDSYYLCPAYDKTLSYTKDLIVKMMGVWGYEGLKIDGQHLNGVPPCYNSLHNHAYPEESVEKLQDFWKMVYDTAVSIHKDAVVEICPCGTCYSFYNLPYINQPVSSDPLNSWQVRLKGKTLKGLMGENAPYYGDHVELSDNMSDWASTVGIGGVIGTKFVWPVGIHSNKETGEISLTKEKEKEWSRWVNIYLDKMLSRGNYIGELYDLGFDKPETHAIKKDGKMYYAFYSNDWEGPVQLRGLENTTYKVTDYVNNVVLGEVMGADPTLVIKFNNYLLIECTPL